MLRVKPIRWEGITKRGDSYLRKQLIHGARTVVVNHAHKKQGDLNKWINALVERRGKNKAVVAMTRRLACLMWKAYITLAKLITLARKVRASKKQTTPTLSHRAASGSVQQAIMQHKLRVA